MNLTITSLTNYEIGHLIHESSRTLVYRGVSKANAQLIIIKLLRSEFPSFNELVQFRNQYTIAKNLEIEGIVKPLELLSYQNGYALIMPDFGGISLGEYYQNLLSGTKDISQFLDIAIQIAEIVYQLHQNRIIHKDIKPANILINPETKEVKIIDFSISSLLPKETQTIQNYSVLEGTLAYISPEQTGRMNRGIDYRSDFYSLGVTFFEMLNGVLPFDTTDPMELVHCHLAKMPILGSREGGTQIPQMLINTVMKLMAKNAEDRYQSGLGLKYDLEKCRQEWKSQGKIEYFELGSRDISDRFLIPEKLYGRDAKVEQLLAAFERVAIPPQSTLRQGGGSEIILVAGFSGIGKTAIVNEVHKPIVKQRGYFIKGKFDQFNRNIPFSALVQSLRDLMGQLLSEGDTKLQQWKDKILDAVGENGQVIVDVIPELEKIIGKQPSVPELSGSAAQNRFNLFFSKFIQVFTSKEHPLVIFLDDLQWADSASLNLLKLLMSEREKGYLLLIGAYRDNEVFPAHPLMLTLDEIRKAEATINTITLAPLSEENINCLVADTLSCDLQVAKPFTELVYQKTKGNPFFTTQFLLGLYGDELIKFNREVGYWEYELTKVKQRALTDDVVEFMAWRLHKLPQDTQKVLKLAACIGNQFDLDTLAIICETPAEEVASALWSALQEGLTLPQSEAYKFFQEWEQQDSQVEGIVVNYRFLHDRVQQASYSLIPEKHKQKTHLKIGQLLLQNTPESMRDANIFAIVNQLNHGTDLIKQSAQREELAHLNLQAGRKAKLSTAYQGALAYLKTGLKLLESDSWATQYTLTLNLHVETLEVECISGNISEAESLAEIVQQQATSQLDIVKVWEIKTQIYVNYFQMPRALEAALEALEMLGLSQTQIWEFAAKNPTLPQVEDIKHLPEIEDPLSLAIMRLLASVYVPALSTKPELMWPVSLAHIDLCEQKGWTSVSAIAYAIHGMLLCAQENIPKGYWAGLLAIKLLDRFHAKAISGQISFIFSTQIQHWQEPLRNCLPALLDALQIGLEVGDLTYGSFCVANYCFLLFWAGENLEEVHKQQNLYIDLVARKIKSEYTAKTMNIWRQLVANLRGFNPEPHQLIGTYLDRNAFLPDLEANQSAWPIFDIYMSETLLCYLLGRNSEALTHAAQMNKYIQAVGASFVGAVANFLDSLVLLAQYSLEQPKENQSYLDRVIANQERMGKWAVEAPMNCQHKYDLIEAEKHRVLGERMAAMEMYDRAIAGAKENEYIQEEAIANELAAKLYLDWGKEKIAATYMQEAYYCYARWGAKVKIDDLEKRYPYLLKPILEKPKLSSLSSATLTCLTQRTISQTTTGKGKILDLTTLMKASRTLSEDISLDGAIVNLMQGVRENAGAETLALMLFQDQVLILTALATGQKATKIDPIPVLETQAVPLSIINQVKRRQKPLVLDNASNNNAYAGDAYIQKHQPQSVLCLPLIDRGNTIGILYLENNQLTGAFTRERVEVLSLLCSQAAISLENARLYRESQNYAQQLEQTQLQLVQSEKMASIGQLTAGVAHEINNPVGFIGGNLDYATEYIQDLMDLLQLYEQGFEHNSQTIQNKIEEIELDYLIEDLPELIESMKTGTKRLTEISKSMRSFSRTDTIVKTIFNIHDGIDSTLLILRHRLKANEVRPEIQVVKNYGNLPEINCYPGQLNQVFMNLIANGIDALDESNSGKNFDEIQAAPNQITITTEIDQEKQQVIIKIRDNGLGMSEEVKDKIFGHLFTTKGVAKGTGLGLSISRQIVVEKHGGKITCTSELGKGTEFTISLPNN
ncbi:MAG: AAA family ATPase [Okeania sp. SIO3I5]|uniref:trifunctional serine/threonine-protein kinase/ATP-binding protein/sensor histidine kinase n=1 Tax=Okeania sp. SIO3I5 TaxID=2607805 RepID=UPI0013BC30C9|nr:ATP-binding sensor histidine kinase [Okeania sp. SIO3I5]NEQ38778.1 AAA family ATPase [Okeania sp. SIO3I5]